MAEQGFIDKARDWGTWLQWGMASVLGIGARMGIEAVVSGLPAGALAGGIVKAVDAYSPIDVPNANAVAIGTGVVVGGVVGTGTAVVVEGATQAIFNRRATWDEAAFRRSSNRFESTAVTGSFLASPMRNP